MTKGELEYSFANIVVEIGPDINKVLYVLEKMFDAGSEYTWPDEEKEHVHWSVIRNVIRDRFEHRKELRQ